MRIVDIDPVIEILEEDLADLPHVTDYDEGFAAGCRWTILCLKMAKEVNA